MRYKGGKSHERRKTRTEDGSRAGRGMLGMSVSEREHEDPRRSGGSSEVTVSDQ